MRKLSMLAGVLLFASPLAMAQIEWQDKPVNLDSERRVQVQELNQSIRHQGGLDRMRKDAETGNAQSQYLIGQMYRLGIVYSQDTDHAVKFFEMAVRQNHPQAIMSLGSMLMGYDPIVSERPSALTGSDLERSQGFAYILKAAELGIADAQYVAGLHYVNGDRLPEDRDLGMFWLSKAGDQGHAEANEVRQQLRHETADLQKSFDAIQGRVMSGDVNAMVELARFYQNGWKVERDPVKAQRLLTVAAKQGSSEAVSLLSE